MKILGFVRQISTPGIFLLTACGSQSPSFVTQDLGTASIDSTAARSEDHEYTFTTKGDTRVAGIYDPNLGQIRQVHQFEQATEEERFSQNGETTHTEVFVQGGAASEAREKFVQVGEDRGVLDILIVVDDSGSMKEEQNNLAAKLSPLLTYVSQSDWQIGVTTTDPRQGCLRGLIKKGQINLETRFSQAIMAGTRGSGTERGILQAVNSLQGTCLSSPWIRPNSTLAVLIVSDEDNCSNGQGCGNNNYRHGSYLTNYLRSIRSPGVDARVYGLIWDPSMGRNACRTAGYQGNIYADVIQQTGGSIGSVCAADYSSTLRDISANIATILKNQFTLANAPIDETLTVSIDGVVLAGSEYRVDSNVLTLNTAPRAGSQIEVAYSYSSLPVTKEFALAYPASEANLSVEVDDIPTSDFQLVSNTIVFNAAPAERARISVVYREPLELVSEFEIAHLPNSDSVDILIDGQPNKDFVREDRRIVFRTPPSQGSQIIVRYQRNVAGTVTIPLITADFIELSAFVNDQEVPFKVSTDSVDVTADSSGSQVVLVYQLDGNHRIDLVHEPSPGSLKVTYPDGTTCAAANLEESRTLMMGGCVEIGVPLSFEYSYHGVDQFELPLSPELLKHITQIVVFLEETRTQIDGVTRKNGVLTFPRLPGQAKVTVIVHLGEQS